MKRILIFTLCFLASFGPVLKSQTNPIDSVELLRLCQALGGFNAGVNTAWNAALAPSEQWDPNNPVTSWYGVTLIPDSQGNLRVLKIDLGGLQLQNSLGFLTTQPLSGLDSLREIRLDSCSLSGHIENFLGPLLSLELIDLDSNSMVYDAASYLNLLNGQSAMKALKTRSTFNSFLGTSAMVLPANMPLLEFFDAGKNGFDGSIPDFITFFPNLVQGYFDGNNFTAMSQTIGNRLSKLLISNNKLSNISDLINVLDVGVSI